MEETQGDVTPGRARSAAEFITLMRALKDRSGLTYRQLEERAAAQGDVLARSTLAGVLGGRALPRPELLAVFVRACGDPDRVGDWLGAWSTLAQRQSHAGRPEQSPPAGAGAAPAGAAPAGSAPAEPGPAAAPAPVRAGSAPVPAEPGAAPGAPSAPVPVSAAAPESPTAPAPATATAFELTPEPKEPDPPAGRERAPRRGRVAAGLAVLLAVAAATTFAALNMDRPADTTPQRMTRSDAVPSGWVRILPLAAPGMCLTDGRVPDGRYTPLVAVQRPCSQAGPQTTLLEWMGGDLYRIQWRHPDYGTGCLKALAEGPGMGLLEPMDNCTTDSRFHVELSGPRGGNRFVLRVDGQGCVGIKGSVATAGAEAVMERCVGRGGQLFAIEPAN